MSRKKNTAWKADRKARAQQRTPGASAAVPNTAPNWDTPCENDGQRPTVGDTGLCGPCCFGEADTANGEW